MGPCLASRFRRMGSKSGMDFWSHKKLPIRGMGWGPGGSLGWLVCFPLEMEEEGMNVKRRVRRSKEMQRVRVARRIRNQVSMLKN